MEDERLTKKERRGLAKEEKRHEREKRALTSKIKKSVIGILVIGILGGGGYWLYGEATKPLPGETVVDLGVEHVNDISGVIYDSNPPTSGPHFPIWAKKGVYDRVISDGHLLHSLEHGYIVISYNCGQEGTPVSEATESAKPLTTMRVQPSGQMSWFTTENPPPDEAGLPNSFQKDECKALVEQLSGFLGYRQRVIIVPRVDLDTRIALTAWGRIEKMDKVDKDRIEAFISAFHNRGPEQTSE